MPPTMAGAPAGPPGAAGPTYTVRAARVGDVGSLVRMYRGQSFESRTFHHPYPVDRGRLVLIFSWMVLSGRLSRVFLHTVPGLGFVLLVACPTGSGHPVAYGTIRFVGARGPRVWARFGFLVEESSRGKGVGTMLAVALWEHSLALGVRRGGGTIQRSNAASRTIVERAGFRLLPNAESDRYAPGAETLGGISDLAEALARYRAGPRAREGVDPTATR